MALVLFIIASAAVEYLAVMHAVSLGLEDPNPLRLSLLGWEATVSLLFHIVPLASIIALSLIWICLTKYLALNVPKLPEQRPKRFEKEGRRFALGIERALKNSLNRVKAALMRSKGFASFWDRLSRAKTFVKSSLIILLAFLSLFFLLSLAAYPKLFLNIYWNNPSTLELVVWISSGARVFVENLTPLLWACTAVNNAIIASAPNLRAFAGNIGCLIRPLFDLSPVGKYLFLQNFAIWVSALAVLLYGFYMRKGYRRKRRLRKV
ncbi:MAG: hypothetical protein QXE00_01170 [Candidatus Bathyarchaeia archaeon]